MKPHTGKESKDCRMLVMVGASAMCPVSSADSSVAVWRVATCPSTSSGNISGHVVLNHINNNNSAEPRWEPNQWSFRLVDSVATDLATKVGRTEARTKHRNIGKLPRNLNLHVVLSFNHKSQNEQERAFNAICTARLELSDLVAAKTLTPQKQHAQLCCYLLHCTV